MAVAMMPTTLLIATATWPAFEAPASAVAASSPVTATISATVRASASAAAIPSATAERPLETGAGIAAYTRGLAWKFAKRFRSLPRNARTCFTWK